MRFKVTKDQIFYYRLLLPWAWNEEPDFITLDGTPVEEGKKRCDCGGPYTCHVHDGQYRYCSNDKCLCHKESAPPLPEELHSAVAGEYAVVLKAMEATINQLIRYLNHHERN